MSSTIALPMGIRYFHKKSLPKKNIFQSLLLANNQKKSCMSIKTFSTFKRWPKPVLESNGDYSKEAFLEDFIGGPLYSEQHSLSHLPFPSIEDTLSKFLGTAIPLAENEEEARSLIEVCEKFPMEAEKLQKRLEIYKGEENSKGVSWLQKWWNQVGYLQYREPVVINVSFYFQLADDETVPDPSNNGEKTMGVMRAAAVLHAVAEYRKQVCTGSLPVETLGRGKNKKPLCSTAFKYMFNACRIPQVEQDTYRIYDPSLHKHCIIAYKGQFFSMDFVDDDGDPLPLHSLESGLENCMKLAEQQKNTVPKIGILTSSDRDSWTVARTKLLQVGGKVMESSFERLESGAFLLCLDDEAPASMRECANIYWHGGKESGENRWFDKSIQIFCESNGKLGYQGEHSMMDGMPAVSLCSHILKTKYQDLAKKQSHMGINLPLPAVQHLFKEVPSEALFDPAVLSLLQKAKEDFHKLVADQQLSIQNFHGYGSKFIKKSGYSPDAYVQSALQLATYRLFGGKQVGTYEATQTRIFINGRTETTRSVSESSLKFVKSMGSRRMLDLTDPVVRKENLSLLRASTESHSTYIQQAAMGHGVDRHFFGLSMLVGKDEKAPVLFDHPLYNRSKYWRVSTSTLPNAPGFGCVVPDGIGIAYEIKSDSVVFTITGREENDWTDRASHLIEEALLEMRMIIDLDNDFLPSKL